MQELEAMQTHIPVFFNQLRQIKEKEKLTNQVNTIVIISPLDRIFKCWRE